MTDLTDLEWRVLRYALRRWYRAIEDGAAAGWIDPEQPGTQDFDTDANIAFLKALEKKVLQAAS